MKAQRKRNMNRTYDRRFLSNLVKNQLGAQFILSIFINFYRFRATMCLSSGETTVFMRHLVLVILCGSLVCRSTCSYIPDSHPHRITDAKCRTNTAVSPDDRHTVARNDKYTKNNLCTKVTLLTILHRDVRSKKKI